MALQQQAQELRTRSGYNPSETIRAFEASLLQRGTVATGQALHFAADAACSGATEIVIKSLWSYAVSHIGIASPRVFVYLRKRCDELESLLKRLPDEQAYLTEEFQIRLGEMILVLREAPARTILSWPKVGPETHAPHWLGTLSAAPQTDVLLRVWRPEGDRTVLRSAGAELCKAIGDGSTEKALFWVRWLLEEEAHQKKQEKGTTMPLTTLERGPTSLPSKQRSGVGFFLLALYAETYKEFAAKGLVRMHEEFQCLLDMWRSGDKRLQGGSRKQVLTILTQILCEVPRWKVPAAPPLIQDQISMKRAILQVPTFFREVIAYDPPRGGPALLKAFQKRGAVEKKVVKGDKSVKGEKALQQMNAYEKAIEDYFGGL